MDLFWTHQEKIQEGMGFGQFSIVHFIWLISMFLLAYYISEKYKKSDDKHKDRIRKAISIFFIVTELIKLYVIYLNGVDVTDYLPLEICSFAAYAIIIDTFLEKSFCREMILYLFLPAGFVALLFPTVTVLPSFNFFTIHQFLFHCFMIAYALARYRSGEVRISYKGFWKAAFSLLVLVICMYFVDVYFQKEFMFLTTTYGNAALMAIESFSGKGITYTIALFCIAILVLHIFFALLYCIDRRKLR
ncbi:MAG: YwaF family protein [Solobacterium sp.]|nr:YwaF family protein [Solobacterium sp.]